MLTILGKNYRLCDQLSRRQFITIGGLTLGGLSLPQLLRAEAQAGIGHSHKAVIMVFLPGGPPHLDMVDLKPEAPVEIRGEFKPIRTTIPGIAICELLPRMAARVDRLAIIRTIGGCQEFHESFMCMTGRSHLQQPPGGWPALGSVVSKVHGPAHPSVPPFVSLSPKMIDRRGWDDPGRPGFLGLAHGPFQPNAESRTDMVLKGGGLGQLRDRKALLASFDHFRRELDASGTVQGMDRFTEQAYDILTSSKLAEALNLDREEPRVRDRYGRGSAAPAGPPDSPAAPLLNDYFLTARRLVEAGVRCVTLAYGQWDWHGVYDGPLFKNARKHLPMLDQGITALIDDLYQHGLEKDVSVVVWGEFGRTPRINKYGGRDHWCPASFAILAGGGMQTGRVIGSTDRLGERPKDRPVSFQEVFATLYHNLGINSNTVTVTDLAGRPHYLVESGVQPIRELL